VSFYSPIDRLAQTLPRPKGTGAEFMTELSKMPGYKAQEAEDRGLQALVNMPKMERAQFMEALKSKPPVVPETRMLQTPHHETYTLPGGENYREFVLRHPQGEFAGVPHHFGGIPNILASVRAKDRTGPNGEKILHIEELQSDWHQQGREKGYNDPKEVNGWKVVSVDPDDPNEIAVVDKNGKEVWAGLNKFGTDRQVIDKIASQMLMPNAPFKKNWHEMALKKMIHHAAKSGYDAIGITPGAEQADRYGFGRHIDTLRYFPEIGSLHGLKNKRFVFGEQNIKPEELHKHIGKELSEKILVQPQDPVNGQMLSGKENLHVGGEGMKGFYDKIVPNFLNQFGKKYGAKVQLGTIAGMSFPDYLAKRNIELRNGEMFSSGFPLHSSAVKKAYEEENPIGHVLGHTFPITPEMRADVTKNGVPLYADGGPVPPLRPLSPQLAALREQMAQQSALNKAYDEAMKNVYTNQMPTFAQWLASQGKAEGGKVENKAEFLKGSKVKDVLYRGGVGYPDMPEDFLKGKARPGYATFASTSPHVAGSYAHPDHDEVGAIAPMHIKAHTVHEFPVTTDKHGSRRFSKTAFDQRAQQLQPGHALVARQVFDYGPRANTKTDPDKLYSYPSDIYAWNDGTEVKSALSKAKGGSIKPVGYTKEQVTVSPNLDAMRYELMSVKRYTKKVK